MADPSDVRLALSSRNQQVYVSRGKDPDSICFMLLDENVAGGGCGPLSNFETIGAMVSVASSDRQSGYLVVGLVPDDVKSVSVASDEAIMGENVFLISVPSLDSPAVLATDNGPRAVPLRASLPPPLSEGGETPPPELRTE